MPLARLPIARQAAERPSYRKGRAFLKVKTFAWLAWHSPLYHASGCLSSCTVISELVSHRGMRLISSGIASPIHLAIRLIWPSIASLLFSPSIQSHPTRVSLSTSPSIRLNSSSLTSAVQYSCSLSIASSFLFKQKIKLQLLRRRTIPS